MNVTELQIVSFTLGRTTRHARLFRQCGVFATALHYRNKGYSLAECLDLLRSFKMNQQSYSMLCDEIQDIASQVFDDEPAPCQFEDEPETVEMSEEFNDIWEGR